MLKCRDVELSNGLILAPLAGITDSSFRRLCKSFGVELVFTEMVSSEGIRRGVQRTLRYLEFSEEERPIGIQIFGADPEGMGEAARIVEERYRPDLIDVNMGCPVKKVTKTGAGASLLKDIKKLKRVIESVISSVSCPVSAKIRLGWDRDCSVEIAEILEGCGISFITVHARKAVDSYGRKADWSVYEKLKERIAVPIVANGDITTPQDADFLLNTVGVEGVMIGRGILGKPWRFALIRDYLEKGECGGEPSVEVRIQVLLHHLSLMVETIGEERSAKRIKKQIYYYFKGNPDSKEVVRDILRTGSYREIVSLIEEYRRKLRSMS
jgi:tRNA-dihydrouridine synthase B